jgi:ribonuclease G
MLRRILINGTSTHLRIAITEDGKLVELFTESPENEHQVGNIYLGRVTRVVQGMNAAFVNIGLVMLIQRWKMMRRTMMMTIARVLKR